MKSSFRPIAKIVLFDLTRLLPLPNFTSLYQTLLDFTLLYQTLLYLTFTLPTFTLLLLYQT